MPCETVTETVLVVISKTPVSAIVRDDGFTDITYLRVIARESSGEEMSRDVVRETVPNGTVDDQLAELSATRCHGGSEAHT